LATAIEDPFALVGTRLDGHLRVDAVVGEGGYGVVYRGFHESLEQPVAVKALKVIAPDDKRVQDALFAKFKDEAKLLYTLSQASLHIVRSMDFGAVTTPAGHWAPYMVLEWLEGRSLAEDLAERRRRGMRGRSLDEALAILEPAAEGLAVAHEQRVAHRDVKPANLFMLAQQDRGPRVKVLDFGIAKIIRDGEGPGTRSPFASFTWLYAAPEQLDPRVGQTGLATDVYAFALVLAELLTDRPPVEGRDPVALLKAATDPTVRPTPRHRGAVVPDAVEHACRRALAVDPRARFASVAELWAALAAARRSSGSGIDARVSTPAVPSLGSGAGRHANAPAASTATGMRPSQSHAVPVSASLAGPMPGSVPVHPRVTPAPLSPPLHTPPPGARAALPPMTGVPPHPQHYPAPMMHHTGMPPSPPPMSPPPGTGAYPRRMIPAAGGGLSIALAVIGLLVGVLFVATCSAVHAACN